MKGDFQEMKKIEFDFWLLTILCGVFLLPSTQIFAQALAPEASNGKLAFHSFRTGNFEVFTMNADGTNQTNVSNNSVTDQFPQWSPDGGKIVFSRIGSGDAGIWVMNADGSNQIRLSDGLTPSWSPDGAKIVFTSGRDFNNGDEIYTMNADGSNQIRITFSSGDEREPRFSPDGSRIAFRSSRTGNQEIWVMNADGSNQINLTNNSAVDDAPSWSPDGARIAFRSQRSGNSEIWAMDSNGGNPINLTNYSNTDISPAWSPDGTKIAFASFRNNTFDIYVMDANGGNQTRLTTDAETDVSPSWQPIVSGTMISGTISYGTSPAKFVSGVNVNAAGTSQVFASSNNSGVYQLSGLTAGGNYTVTPSKEGNVNGITSFDATLVLRCVAAGAGCALSANQRSAADSDNDGSVSSFDATQILRFVAANGSNANTGQTGKWKFLPAFYNYFPLNNSISNENYTAILIGEIDGDWTPPNNLYEENVDESK